MTSISQLWHLVIGLPILSTAAFFLCGWLIERIVPIEHGQPKANLILNISYAFFGTAFSFIATPLLGMTTAIAIKTLGGGLIHLPSAGWPLVAAAVVYILSVDFMEYVFHRAQHRWPFLWAMHSLHHSDPSVNVTTTTRHFWLEVIVKAPFVYLPVALLFDVSPALMAIYGASTALHYANHLNARLGLGRLSFLINTPHYHRLHHAVSDRYRDKNFAAYFPIFDVIFGTYHAPETGDFPETGLATGARPRNLLDALAWPLLSRINVLADTKGAIHPPEEFPA